MSFSGKVMTDEEEILYQSTYDLITDCTTVKQTPEIDRSLGIEGTWWIYSVGMKNNYNIPDLEMRGVPGLLILAGVKTINTINCYRILNDDPVLVDQTMSWEYGFIKTVEGDDWDGKYTWKSEDMLRLDSLYKDVPLCDECGEGHEDGNHEE